MGEAERRLGDGLLSRIKTRVAVPGYDRAALRQHTVHLGVGAFHRAHQAVYLDDLLGMDGEPRWGECGMGVLPADARMRDALQGQDCLYTLVVRSAGSETARVIGSMADYVLAPEGRERAIEKLAAEQTRLVSLTVTEGGYFIDEATREFTPDHPEIEHDLRHPEQPATSLGLLVASLGRRRARGLKPFTLMSCDNLQSNGDVLKGVVLSFARLRDPGLADWIEAGVAFPNSMVDRITPATTEADKAGFEAEYGYQDAWPVMTEPFLQWVIEDHFCNGRPAWEKVGAQMVADVAPYELMKMRLLNGSHLAMAYLGALAGFSFVHQVMADAGFVAFIRAFMEEVTPVVPVIPGTSVEQYKHTLVERFSNPAIRDQVTRICSEGSAKMPKWVLPSLVELLAKERPVRLLSLVIGSWIFYLGRGVDERGRPLEIVDARADELRRVAAGGGADPRAMLAVGSIFGQVLPAHAEFVEQVRGAMAMLAEFGAAETMRRTLVREPAR